MRLNHHRKIRIHFLVSTLGRQGPVIQLYNLVKYLDPGFEPTVLTLSPEPKDSLLPRFRQLGVACYSLGLSRLASVFLALSRLKQFLRCHPGDIIHTSGFRADLLSAWGLRGIPRIITRHPAFHESVLNDHPITGRAIERLHISSLKRVEQVVCVSGHVQKSAPECLRSCITVIHNGVDTETFCGVSTQEQRSLRSKLGLPQEKRVFITVGHLSTGKDPLTVIRGFLNSDASRNGVLVALGDGPLRTQCEELSRLSNNVRLVGHINDVVTYLEAADVFVSGSLSEGLPMAVIEGLACGLPVVLSDIEPHQEIIGLTPHAGVLFPLKDESALAHCLDKVIDAEYPSRSEAAVNLVRSHLNARAMSAEYQALYTRVYDEHTRQS